MVDYGRVKSAIRVLVPMMQIDLIELIFGIYMMKLHYFKPKKERIRMSRIMENSASHGSRLG